MIKAEVVFDGDTIFIGDFGIAVSLENGIKNDDGELVGENIEKAIAYCLEQSK